MVMNILNKHCQIKKINCKDLINGLILKVEMNKISSITAEMILIVIFYSVLKYQNVSLGHFLRH